MLLKTKKDSKVTKLYENNEKNRIDNRVYDFRDFLLSRDSLGILRICNPGIPGFRSNPGIPGLQIVAR